MTLTFPQRRHLRTSRSVRCVAGRLSQSWRCILQRVFINLTRNLSNLGTVNSPITTFWASAALRVYRFGTMAR